MTTLHPVEYSFATPSEFDLPGNYEGFCEITGLEPTEEGWGFLHCVDDDGLRYTAGTDDPAYLELLITANGVNQLGLLSIPPGKFPIARAGWPDEWVGLVSPQQQGRNERCQCGSGQKYKRCHGRFAPRRG